MIGRLFQGLFPHYCVFCKLRSQRSVPLCRDCQGELQSNRNCCARCAIPLPASREGKVPQLCGNCLQSPPPFHRVIAPWLYTEHMAYLIQRWKFAGEQRLTPLLASLWLQRAAAPGTVDLLVPVPLHWRRLWRRGFNQSELLGRQLRAHCPAFNDIPLDHRRVRRKQPTAAQSGMNARQRAGNLVGAFTVTRPCDNLRVAIVDDVLTTGATAAAVAEVLARAGASHIEVWCLARTAAPQK